MNSFDSKHKMKKIIGIDYSLTSPAVCVHPFDKSWSIDRCRFGFLTGSKKMEGSWNGGQFQGFLFDEYDNDIMRFIQNARKIKNIAAPGNGDVVSIEGYAFGARGQRIFQIGEATGFLLLFMMMNSDGSSFINSKRMPLRPAPSQIKKFATGKGNANKEKMYEEWLKEKGEDLLKIFGLKKLGHPVDDIVDSYWITKHAYMKHKGLLNGQ